MWRALKLAGWVLLGLLVVIAIAVPFAIGMRPILGARARPLTDQRFETTPVRLERGRHLVTAVNGCLYCHGELDWQAPGFPLKPGSEGGGRSWDRERLLFVTAPNITPDPETGAGEWSDDMLGRAIREGIGHHGRTLFPLMPYAQYRSMSDEDLASIVVYVRTLPALKHALPSTAVPFPVNRLINTLPEPIAAPVPDPVRSNVVAYGEYLTRMGACRDCHTPTDARNQPIAALEFGGGFAVTGPPSPSACYELPQRHLLEPPRGRCGRRHRDSRHVTDRHPADVRAAVDCMVGWQLPQRRADRRRGAATR